MGRKKCHNKIYYVSSWHTTGLVQRIHTHSVRSNKIEWRAKYKSDLIRSHAIVILLFVNNCLLYRCITLSTFNLCIMLMLVMFNGNKNNVINSSYELNDSLRNSIYKIIIRWALMRVITNYYRFGYRNTFTIIYCMCELHCSCFGMTMRLKNKWVFHFGICQVI